MSSDEEHAVEVPEHHHHHEERQYNRFDLTGYADDAVVGV
jgi:hypothetical protein